MPYIEWNIDCLYHTGKDVYKIDCDRKIIKEILKDNQERIEEAMRECAWGILLPEMYQRTKGIVGSFNDLEKEFGPFIDPDLLDDEDDEDNK